MEWPKRFLKDEQGDNVVSASILMLLIMAVFASVITMFSLMYSNIVVVDATRDGSRHQALNYGPAEDRVRSSIQDGRLFLSNISQINATENSNYVTVSTRYNQPTLVPGLPVLLGGGAWGDHFNVGFDTSFKKERP